jgi:Fe-S-cluster containining protein
MVKSQQGDPERFVLRVYQDVDREVAYELERLRTVDGIEPPCRKGCTHCCRQGIPVTLPEARVVANFIQRELTPERRSALRERLKAWFTWVRDELPDLLEAGMDQRTALYEHGPPCAMLENDACSVYSARPAICRIHYVRSDPRSCMPQTNPESLEDQPVVLETIHMRTGPHIRRIRQYIEKLGLEYDESVSSLPRWLAVELGWSELLDP